MPSKRPRRSPAADAGLASGSDNAESSSGSFPVSPNSSASEIAGREEVASPKSIPENSAEGQAAAADSAGQNLRSEGGDDEILDTLEDIMAHDNENASQENEEDQNSTRSESPVFLMREQPMVRDDGFPLYLRKDILKVPDSLRNLSVMKFDFPKLMFEDKRKILTPPAHRVRTLDGVSKCFHIIPEGSLSNYMQPFEGPPMVFVSKCDGVAIPKHILRVLFFFYRLQRFIEQNGVTMFVVPTRNLKLNKSRTDKNKVTGIYEEIERSLVEPEIEQDDFGGSPGEFTLAALMKKRSRQSDGECQRERAALTIRLGFTGAFFKEDGAPKQMLFCCAFITGLRNFALLDYIYEKFLVQPRAPMTDKYNDWNDLVSCWRRILQYEASVNCGLLGDPCEHTTEPSGELGVFTLTSSFSAPLRMADYIQRTFKPATSIQIMGTPKLSYRDDEGMDEYWKYTSEYLNENAKAYSRLQSDISAYNMAGEKEQRDMEFDTTAPGGWPMKCVQQDDGAWDEYIRFGLPQLPIMMGFKMFSYMAENVSMDTFQINLGGLPKDVMKSARNFLTCKPYFDGEECPAGETDSDDDELSEMATPYKITEKYYGPTSTAGLEFMTNGMMLPWYHSVVKKMHQMREGDKITPTRGMDMLLNHLSQCMQNHSGVMKSGGYRSDHLSVAWKVVEKIHKTNMKNVLLSEYYNKMRDAGVHQQIRHDTYMTMCMVFWRAWTDINRDWKTNVPNLEALIEVVMGSVHYLVGSHDPSFAVFFQGMMMMNARGHLNVQVQAGITMDWRKPNSSGMGFILERINSMQEIMGMEMGMRDELNKLKFMSNSRATDGSMEDSNCYQLTGGNVTGSPSPVTTDQPQVVPEGRASSYKHFISNGFQRDSTDGAITMSTADPKKTNNRELLLKIRCTFPHICGMVTNKLHDAEESQTIYCVLHATCPGALNYKRIRLSTGDPADVDCDINEGRAQNPEDGPRRWTLIKMLAFTRTFAGVMVALPHRSGAFPFRVSCVTSAFLEWMFMLVKQHVFGIFNTRVIESFGRMRQGYESRHVAGAVWMTSIIAFMKSNEDSTQAAMRATLACAFDALPMTEAISVVHSVLLRGVHAGWVSIACCLLQAMHVPVIPVEWLWDFFASDESCEACLADLAPLSEGSGSSTVSDDSSDREVIEACGKMMWVDEVEKSEGKTEEPAAIPAKFSAEVSEPAAAKPEPLAAVKAAPESKVAPAAKIAPEPPTAPEKQDNALERRVKHAEDVIARFELLVNVNGRAIVDLEDEVRKLAAFQNKSRSVTNELRSQMSGVLKILDQLAGAERTAAAINESSTHHKLEVAFREKQYRQGGGSNAPQQYRQGGGLDQQQQYRQGGGSDAQFRQGGGSDAQFRQGGGSDTQQQYRQGGGLDQQQQYRQGSGAEFGGGGQSWQRRAPSRGGGRGGYR